MSKVVQLVEKYKKQLIYSIATIGVAVITGLSIYSFSILPDAHQEEKAQLESIIRSQQDELKNMLKTKTDLEKTLQSQIKELDEERVQVLEDKKLLEEETSKLKEEYTTAQLKGSEKDELLKERNDKIYVAEQKEKRLVKERERLLEELKNTLEEKETLEDQVDTLEQELISKREREEEEARLLALEQEREREREMISIASASATTSSNSSSSSAPRGYSLSSRPNPSNINLNSVNHRYTHGLDPIEVGEKKTVNATAYIATCSGCIGITKTGVDVRNSTPNIIAVDPTIIPLGSKVELFRGSESLGIYSAEDIGSAIVGYRIDILMETERQALNFGRRNITVKRIS